MTLHTPSLFFMFGSFLLLMSGYLRWCAGEASSDIQGAGSMAWGHGLFGIATILAAAEASPVPPGATNGMVVLGLILIHAGVSRVEGRKGWPCLGAGLVFVVFLAGSLEPIQRVVINSVVFGVLVGRLALVMLSTQRFRSEGLPRYSGALFALASLALFARALLAFGAADRAGFDSTLGANYSLAGFAVNFVAGSLILAAVVQQELFLRFREVQDRLKILSGLLPICMYCSKIRDDAGAWVRVDSYIAQHSEAAFSHGVCPVCFEEHHPDIAKEL